MVVEEIIEKHAEDTAYLWLQRDAAVREPHYSLADLARLDNRVEANIDGLRIAGDAIKKLTSISRSFCLQNLQISAE